MLKKDQKTWIIKRKYALKILNCALNIIVESEDFVEGSKKIEILLSEFENEIYQTMKFKIGDRVERGGKRGTIKRCYSKEEKRYGVNNEIVLGPYPELYEVLWDNGETGQSYLPHGLKKINPK